MAAVALLAPFASRAFTDEWEGRADARVTRVEQLRAWLTATRELAAAVLARGYADPQPAPRRLRPNSPAWRTLQNLMRPLESDERQDLELVVAVADDWLGRLKAPDESTVALLSQAMDLAQAMIGSQNALHDRVAAPDREDARRGREHNSRFQATGRAKRRKATPQQLEQAAARELTASPHLPWPEVCRRVARRFGYESDSRVRHILKDSRGGGARDG